MTIPFVTITKGGVTCFAHLEHDETPKCPVVENDGQDNHKILSVIDADGKTIGKLCIPTNANIQ